MIYRNKVETSNILPENIQVCINKYKEALDAFILSDYKMRLNENARDTYGNHNRAFRNAEDERSNAKKNMTESLKAAFVFAQDVASDFGNKDLVDITADKFHSIVTNSVYYGSDACECPTIAEKTVSVENYLRNDIERQKEIVSRMENLENKDNLAM